MRNRTFALWIFCLALAGTLAAQEMVVPPAGGTSFTGGSVATEIATPGLTLTKTLGTEVLTQTCAGWGLAAPVGAWSCSGDTITRTASGANLTITNTAAVVGTTYEVVVVTATVTAGSVTASIGGSSGSAISTATTTTAYFTATSTAALTLTASATFAGTITLSTTSAKALTSTISSDTGPLVMFSPASIRLVPASGYGIYNYGPSYFGAGSASAPSISFDSSKNTGWYQVSATTPCFSSNGTCSVLMNSSGVQIRSSSYFGFAGSSAADGAADTFIYRDAAGVLGLRNSTTAQEMRVYNTYTSSTDYEAARIYYSSNVLRIESGKGSGGGTYRNLEIRANGFANLIFNSSGVQFGATPMPTADLGATMGHSAVKWSDVYVGQSIQGSVSKALTDNVATNFVKIAVAQGAAVSAEVRFTVKVIDAGLDQQIETGRVAIACINKGGTVTCATPVVYGNSTPLVTAGTLAATVFAVSEVDADTVTISAQSDTSLTATSHTITHFVEKNGTETRTSL